MPIITGGYIPLKKYSLLTTLLFAGWTFRPGDSDEGTNRLVFDRGPYIFILSNYGVTLTMGFKEGFKRPYRYLQQKFDNPAFIYNISENMDAFDLRAPELGLQPAIQVYRDSWFKSMASLLNRWVWAYHRPPNMREFIKWLQRHRKQHDLPSSTNRLLRLIKFGNYIFWILEEKLTRTGRHVEVLSLGGRLNNNVPADKGRPAFL